MAHTSSGDPGGENPVDPRLARRRQDAIGNRLRQMYDSVVDESVPDEFMSFLHQAEKRDTDAGDKEGAPRANGGSGSSEAGS
jgi:hypothetical protein